MSSKISYLSPENVVLVVNEGRVGLKEHRRTIEEAIRVGLLHDCVRTLVDDRRLEGGLDAADIYELPAIYEAYFVSEDARIAVIVSDDPGSRERHDFYEAVCRSRNFDVRVFQDRREALDWLKR